MTGFYNDVIDCTLNACRAQTRQAVKGFAVESVHTETTASTNLG